MFRLAYLSLSTSLGKLIEIDVHSVFSAYFDELSMIVYIKSVWLYFIFYYWNDLYMNTYMINVYAISN